MLYNYSVLICLLHTARVKLSPLCCSLEMLVNNSIVCFPTFRDQGEESFSTRFTNDLLHKGFVPCCIRHAVNIHGAVRHFEAAYSAEYYIGAGKEFVEVYHLILDTQISFVFSICNFLTKLFPGAPFEPDRTQTLLLQVHLHANYPFWYTMQVPCGSSPQPNPVSFVLLTVPYFNSHRDSSIYSPTVRVAVRKSDEKIHWQKTGQVGKARAFYDLAIAENCSVFELNHNQGLIIRSDALFSVFCSYPDVRILVLSLHRGDLYQNGPYGNRPFPIIHMEHPKAVQKIRSLSHRTLFMKLPNLFLPSKKYEPDYLNPSGYRYSASTERLSEEKWNEISQHAANVVIYPQPETITAEDNLPFTPDMPGLDAAGDILHNGSIISLEKSNIQLLEPTLVEQLEIAQNPMDIDSYVDSQCIPE